MALELSTIGMSVGYAAESTAGTRPTTGYTVIPEVKSIPAIGSDVNAIQSTPLSEAFHTYVQGVKGGDGAIGLTVNDCPTFRTAWDALLTAYATAAASSKEIWFEFKYPTGAGAMESFFLTGKPVELGYGGAEVDAVVENTANILPSGGFVWATAST